MVRIWGVALSDTKSAAIAGLLAVALFSGLLAIRHLTTAAQANGTTAHNLDVITSHSSSSTDSSPDNSGEVLNNGVNNGAASSSGTSVTVNGQPITVPANGSVSQTLDDNGTTTTVNVESQNSSTSQGAASNSNHSSVNVNVHSASQGDSP